MISPRRLAYLLRYRREPPCYGESIVRRDSEGKEHPYQRVNAGRKRLRFYGHR